MSDWYSGSIGVRPNGSSEVIAAALNKTLHETRVPPVRTATLSFVSQKEKPRSHLDLHHTDKVTCYLFISACPVKFCFARNGRQLTLIKFTFRFALGCCFFLDRWEWHQVCPHRRRKSWGHSTVTSAPSSSATNTSPWGRLLEELILLWHRLYSGCLDLFGFYGYRKNAL